jgi:hypothetical protein
VRKWRECLLGSSILRRGEAVARGDGVVSRGSQSWVVICIFMCENSEVYSRCLACTQVEDRESRNGEKFSYRTFAAVGPLVFSHRAPLCPDLLYICGETYET